MRTGRHHNYVLTHTLRVWKRGLYISRCACCFIPCSLASVLWAFTGIKNTSPVLAAKLTSPKVTLWSQVWQDCYHLQTLHSDLCPLILRFRVQHAGQRGVLWRLLWSLAWSHLLWLRRENQGGWFVGGGTRPPVAPHVLHLRSKSRRTVAIATTRY